MTAEGTGAAIEVAATLAMAPADSSDDNGGGRQEWRRNDSSGNGDCGGDGGDCVIGHGIIGKDIPIITHLVKARRWSKR